MLTVFQNQRHYGLAGWLGPAPFERKQWTDSEGTFVPLSPEELPLSDARWTPIITELTDAEGWMYSTSYAHIAFPREGGRACKRSTDRVRQRKWLKCNEVRSDGVHESVSTLRRGRPVDVQRGLQQFMMLFSEITTRRKLWEYLPWDPIAWLLLHAEHQEYLSSFEALQLRLNECLTVQPDESIEELMVSLEMGVRISRAAYGYAMAAGHMDTIENFIAMRTIHSQYFDPVAGASVDANLEAVRSFAGFSKEDIVMSDWSNREFQPCHFLALDSTRQCIVLAIRGSMEMGDLVTDISGAPLSVDIGGVSGKVHEGCMAAAIYVQCKTAPMLLDLFEKYPGWSLFITGHSVGGGVAALLSLILKFENAVPPAADRLRCVAVGSAAVMSENLAELCKDFVTSLVFRYDVVPRLSAYSIEAMMVELVNSSPAKKTVDSIVQTATNAVQSLRKTYETLRKTGQKEQHSEKTAGLRLACELAADEDAVARAIHAVEHLSVDMGSERRQSIELTQLSAAPSTSRCSVNGFCPLFPPGRVVWLLGSKLLQLENASKEQWWGQLQNWSLETMNAFKRSTSFASAHDQQGLNEKVASDLSWLKEWIAEDPSSQEQASASALDECSSQRDSPQGELKEGMTEASDSADAVLIEAERKTFSRLLVHPLMLQDHLPRSYTESFKALSDRFRSRTK